MSGTSSKWEWDSIPSYRLREEVVEDYLTEIFGNWDFSIEVSKFQGVI